MWVDIYVSRSAKEAEEKIKKALDKGEVLPTEARFDSNCITPGRVALKHILYIIWTSQKTNKRNNSGIYIFYMYKNFESYVFEDHSITLQVSNHLATAAHHIFCLWIILTILKKMILVILSSWKYQNQKHVIPSLSSFLVISDPTLCVALHGHSFSSGDRNL